jgi:hypothetical protein
MLEREEDMGDVTTSSTLSLDAYVMDDFDSITRDSCSSDEDIIKTNVNNHCNLCEDLVLAASKGDFKVISELLNNPEVDPSSDDNYAIVVASNAGHLKIVNRLLEDPRVDPSANNNEAVILAYTRGRWDVVKRLLEDIRVKHCNVSNCACKIGR